LLKLWFAETGRVPDEFKKPVFIYSLTSLGGAAAVNTHFINPRKAYVSGDAMFDDRHNYKISAIGPPSTYEGADRLNRR